MKLFYLTYPDAIYSSGLIWHQVFSLLNKLCLERPELRVTLLCFVPFPEWCRRRQREKLIRGMLHQNIELISVPAFFKRSWIFPLFPLFWLSTIPLAAWLIRKKQPTLIHARGLVAGFIASLIPGRLPWLLDLRGLFPEEGVRLGFWPDQGLAFRLWKKVESRLLKKCTAVNFVSEKMEAFYSQHSVQAKSHLIPSGVDTDFFSPPAEGAPERATRPCVVYSGSFGWGQMKELKKLFRSLQRVKPNVELLFLQPQSLAINRSTVERELSGFFSQEEFRFERCWPEEVPGKLRQAQAGLLVRDRSPLNEVAWPIKCLEYWACGLPVLGNDAVAAVGRWIEREKIGVLLTLQDEEVDQTRLLDWTAHEKKMQEKSRQAALTHFSQEKTAQAYLNCYDKIAAAKGIN